MAGNWKMNLNHLEAIAVAQKLVYGLDDKDYDAVDVAVIPPFTDIRSIQTLVDGDRLRLQYGAQDLSPEVSGAFTGDISGSMLAKLGCTYVVIGHSERRAIHNESDALINRKIKAALANELTPIFCVGEELAIREAGTHVSHVIRQVRAGLEGFTKPELKKIVIAYEPVWAIGVTAPADAAYINGVCAKIKDAASQLGTTNLQILYGGSAKQGLFEKIAQSVDGLFLGRSAHDVKNLKKIVQEVESVALELAK